MMTKQPEALKQVLPELLWYEQAGLGRISSCDAIHNIREVLAEPQQEPVAWRWRMSDVHPNIWNHSRDAHPNALRKEPLYTSPPTLSLAQRKPLTVKEIRLIMDGRGEEGDDNYVEPVFDPFGVDDHSLFAFVRAIEAAHGITGEQK